MFLDSECYSCCIVLICFILSHYAISESLRASSITRGSRDRFANPMCEPPAVKGSCKCDNLGASCIVDNCPVCRCNTKNTTFSPVDGKCVDNDKFAFLIGCDRYSDGSVIFVIDKTDLKACLTLHRCWLEKDIEVPTQTTNSRCFIQWKMTRFFNYSVWDPLPFTDENFAVIKRNGDKLTLKLNLTKVPEKWRGQIISLYIRCINGRRLGADYIHNTEGVTETRCVLIKFAGEFKTLYLERRSKKLMPLTTGDAISAGVRAAADAIWLERNVTQPGRNAEKQSGNSSTTIVIIVVVVLIVICFVVGSILLYVFYIRKRYQKGTEYSREVKKANKDIETTAPVLANVAETSNATDSIKGNEKSRNNTQISLEPVEVAPNEYRVYKISVDYDYYYIQPDEIEELHLQAGVEENTCDEATDDDISAQLSVYIDTADHEENNKKRGRSCSNDYHILEQARVIAIKNKAAL